jgi:hypothetical protein
MRPVREDLTLNTEANGCTCRGPAVPESAFKDHLPESAGLEVRTEEKTMFEESLAIARQLGSCECG